MLKIYDKAKWHIDAGEDSGVVIDKLKAVLEFLDKEGMLTSEGKEILDLGVDSSVSIHERMLTDKGRNFMESNYDKIMYLSAKNITIALEQAINKR
ncbi:hypothetical protein [Fusobacterium hwasookii]